MTPAFQPDGFQSDEFQVGQVSTVIVGSGKHKHRAFRLSELSDGDRLTTAEFLKSHIAQTPERVAFTQAPITKAKPSILTTGNDASIIAVILASDL